MRCLVARCGICGSYLQLQLVFDPATLRTDFDMAAMAIHQLTHQATAAKNPRSDG